MSDPGLSPTAKALLAAAKADGPSAAARAKIWGGVAASGVGAGAVGAAAVGGGTAGTASSASISVGAAGAAGAGGKLVAIGALFGSAITVGIAATLLGIGTSPTLRPEPQYALYEAAEPGAGAAREMTAANASAETPAFTSHAGAVARVAAQGVTSGPAALKDVPAHPRSEAPRVVAEDTLMRESALVAEARGALVRGDAEKALSVLKTAKGLKHRELEPEELSLEAKALRALGDEDSAIEREMTLRTKFPEHALAH